MMIRTLTGGGNTVEWSNGSTIAVADESGVTVGIAGRITNVPELANALGHPAAMPLAALLREGWHRWGRGLADRLRGSFLLVVHNSRDRRTFVARDALGVTPAFYAASSEFFIVGTSSRQVRALTGINHQPDRAPLADFLIGGIGDFTHSFFKGIHRLPPASTLDYAAGDLSISRYWTPAAAPDIKGSLSALAEQFTELTDRALAHCHVPGQTGLLLSGGLDSSYIAGSLLHSEKASKEVLALSMTFERDPNWHDKKHLEALRKYLPFTFAELPSDTHNPLAGLDEHLVALDGPWFWLGHSITFAATQKLADAGFPYILSGHGGDEVIGYGRGRLNELARAGNWIDFLREAPVTASLQHNRRWEVISPYLDHIRLVRAVRNRLRGAAKSPPPMAGIINDDAMELMENAYGPPPSDPITRFDHSERSVHEYALSSPMQARAFEVMDGASDAIGVETRMPFCDRDLVEFSLGLPSEMKLGGGFTRRIMREAMRGRVPETVRTRSDKFEFSGAFVAGLTSNGKQLRAMLDVQNASLRELINHKELKRLQDAVSQTGTQLKREDAFAIWRVIVASKWIDMERNLLPNVKLQNSIG